MKALKAIALAIATAAAATACGGGGSADVSGGGSGSGTDQTLSVYRYFGSVQCTGGGTSLSALERQLVDAGVRVAAASCGVDGRAYIALCGAPDGRIGVFEVGSQHAALAQALGFSLLSSLPDAVRVPCG